MITKIEIPSKKRSFKAVVAILSIILIVSGVSYFNLIGEVIHHLKWWNASILVIVCIAFIIFFVQLLQYVIYNGVKAVVEIVNDDTVQFYSLSSSGKKINKSEHPLNNISRMYLKKTKRMRGLILDKCIQYKVVKPGIFQTEDIKILPDLFEATDEDINKLIHFIHGHRPEIEIGYDGIWK